MQAGALPLSRAQPVDALSHLGCLCMHGVQLFWAQMHGLSSDEVLFAFGRHYRDLEPSGTSHQNIRSIIANGMGYVRFASPPLSPKVRNSGGLPSWAAAGTGAQRTVRVLFHQGQGHKCLLWLYFDRLRALRALLRVCACAGA